MRCYRGEHGCPAIARATICAALVCHQSDPLEGPTVQRTTVEIVEERIVPQLVARASNLDESDDLSDPSSSSSLLETSGGGSDESDISVAGCLCVWLDGSGIWLVG